MSSNLTTRPLVVPRSESPQSKWALRRDIPLAILAWVAVSYIILIAANRIVRTLLLLVLATLLAYALAPAVRFLQRYIPRVFAILIVYLLVLGAVSFLLYLIANTAVQQVSSLAKYITALLTPGTNGQLSPLEQTLRSFNISQEQISTARTQIISYVEGFAGSIVPLLTSFFDVVLNTILVAVISIYLLIDGSRAARWIRRNAPRPARASFLLDTLQGVVGGYIRGQLLLCTLIGILVGGVTFLFHVPYALLLGILAFVLEFIPIIGTLISGAICVLLALTQGWLIAVGVLISFVVIHIIEGDVVGPRVVGQAIGLHPVISLAALIAGSELFGIWGALFASPIAGVLQVIITEIWKQWRASHPEQFERASQQIADTVEQTVTSQTDQSTQADHPLHVE